MTSSVVVLAQGRQTRFTSLTYPKCLIRVGGETLLMRTLRLIPGREANLIVPPDLTARAESPVLFPPGTWAFRSLNEPGYCVLDGLIQTKDLWSRDGRTIILLGDVCYSRATIDAVFSDSRDCVFFGSPDLSRTGGELYALAFDHGWVEYLYGVSGSMPCRAIKHTVAQPGHLRNVLWDVQDGVGLSVMSPDARYYRIIDDFTTDFDTDEDLAQIPGLERALTEEVWS